MTVLSLALRACVCACMCACALWFLDGLWLGCYTKSAPSCLRKKKYEKQKRCGTKHENP